MPSPTGRERDAALVAARAVDPRVGITVHKRIGDRVERLEIFQAVEGS